MTTYGDYKLWSCIYLAALTEGCRLIQDFNKDNVVILSLTGSSYKGHIALRPESEGGIIEVFPIGPEPIWVTWEGDVLLWE